MLGFISFSPSYSFAYGILVAFAFDYACHE